MTRVLIETKVGLNPAGYIGAFLLIGAPAFAGLAINSRLEQVARSARYASITGANVLEDWSEAIGQLYMTGSICLAASLFGLVLVMVGRTYTHDVRSGADQQETPAV